MTKKEEIKLLKEELKYLKQIKELEKAIQWRSERVIVYIPMPHIFPINPEPISPFPFPHWPSTGDPLPPPAFTVC
jgi:hypothetical protein